MVHELWPVETACWNIHEATLEAPFTKLKTPVHMGGKASACKTMLWKTTFATHFNSVMWHECREGRAIRCDEVDSRQAAEQKHIRWWWGFWYVIPPCLLNQTTTRNYIQLARGTKPLILPLFEPSFGFQGFETWSLMGQPSVLKRQWSINSLTRVVWWM